MTVVDDGAAGSGVTTVVEVRGGDAVVSACTHPAMLISTSGSKNAKRIGVSHIIRWGDYTAERQNDTHSGVQGNRVKEQVTNR